MNSAVSLRSLRDEVLATIRRIPEESLSPDTALLLGAVDVQPILELWDKLQKHLASAKLAIVRDEFAFRFPALSEETEGFSFGLRDPMSDRYMSFLKPHEPSDIIDLVTQLLDDVYPHSGIFHKHRVQGLVPLGVKLAKLLTSYAQEIEARLHPYAAAIGEGTGA